MKKRIVLFTLIGMMACTMLSACGKKKEEEKSEQVSTSVSSEAQPVQKDAESAENNGSAESETFGQNSSGESEAAGQPQVVLQDNGDAEITIPEGQALGGG